MVEQKHIMVSDVEETVVLFPNEDFSKVNVIAILNRPNMQTSSGKIKTSGQFAYFLESRNISKQAKVYVCDNPSGFYRVNSTGWFGLSSWTLIKETFQLREI